MNRAPSFRLAPSTPAAAKLGPSALGLVATLLFAAAAPAQASPPDRPTIEDEIEVRLVELEVQVSDRRGEPIEELDIDDFELLVDGEPVEIEHFEAPPTTSARAGIGDAVPSEESEPPVWLAIYVDRRFLQPGDLEDVKTHLGRFLTEELPANGRAMLVVAGGELDLKVAFTRSTDEVVEALAEVDGEDTGYLLAEYRNVLADLQRRWNAGDEAFALDPRNSLDFRLEGGESDLDGGSGALDGNGSQGARFSGQRVDREPRAYVQQIDAFHRQLHGELQQAAAELQRTVQLLAGLSGRRHLLYVGNHVPTAASRTLFEAWREAFGRDDGRRVGDNDNGASPGQMLDSSRFDALTAGTRFETGGDLFTTLALDTSASGVVIHAVEASALRSRQYLGGVDLGQATFGQSTPETQSFATSVSLAAADGLQALTEATGGRLLQRSKNFDDFFTGLSRDLGRPYVLGFTPDATVEPHEVEVRLRDRGDRRLRRADVRHPHAVRLPSRDQELAQRTVAALMLGDGLDNPLDAEIELGSPRLADDEDSGSGSSDASGDDAGPGRVLPLTIRLPMARLALVPDQQAHAGRLAIFATVGDLGGEIAPVSKTVVPVRVRNSDLLTALGRGVDVNLQLRLPEGARQVAVTVRDELRPADSTLVASIAPPAAIAGDARPAEADASE